MSPILTSLQTHERTVYSKMADSNNTDSGQMNSHQQQTEDTAGNDGRSAVHLLPYLSPVGTQMFGTSIVVGDLEAWSALYGALLAISPVASPFFINSKHWHGIDENGRRTINSAHWFTPNEHDGPTVNTVTFPDGTTQILSDPTDGQEAGVAETEAAN